MPSRNAKFGQMRPHCIDYLGSLPHQKIARAVKTALDAHGIMLVQLNGAAAGQSVPHIHFHVLPRQHGLELTLHGRKMVDAAVLEPIAAKIRAAL